MAALRNNTTAQVYTELGSWGMPTIDCDGLAALALLRFVDIPVTLKSGASRTMTSTNTLPVIVFRKGAGPSATASPLNAGGNVVAGLAQLIGHLSSNTTLPDPNHSLTPFMVAESTAFVSLIQSRFGPAREHELFRIDRNYADIYHTLLEKERSFPLNRILPYIRRNDILRTLKHRSPDKLYFDSKIALAALSTRLGDGGKKFFYGNQPSVLDAVVFGYLASVLYTPLPVSTLRNQISRHKNLVDFTKRIATTYFSGPNLAIVDPEAHAAHVSEMAHLQAQDRARRATQGSPTEDIETLSAEEKERRKWNGYFIWGSVAVFVTHLLVGSEIEFDISAS